MHEIKKSDLVPIAWTAESLKMMREGLGLTQKEMANIIGITKGTISHLECDLVKNPLIQIGYGTILERCFAMQNGYIPAYRKIGTNEFEERIID